MRRVALPCFALLRSLRRLGKKRGEEGGGRRGREETAESDDALLRLRVTSLRRAVTPSGGRKGEGEERPREKVRPEKKPTLRQREKAAA
jgi:hypothetical protein